MNKKRGGLLNELEQRIEACNQLQNDYECNINFLTNRNENYHYIYNESFKNDWIIKNCIKNNYKIFDIIEYRQSLIDNICYNNDLIQDYKKRLEKSINISTFLQKIYFFINFNSKYKNNTIIKKQTTNSVLKNVTNLPNLWNAG